MAASCMFCEVAAERTPAKMVHRDRSVVAFHDRHPQAPLHVIVAPRRHVSTLTDLPNDARTARLLGRLMLVARHVAKELGLHETGFRVVVNNGVDAGQAVPHLHVHVLGGRAFEWPPG